MPAADKGTSEPLLSGVSSMAVAAFFFSIMVLLVKLLSPTIPNQQIVLIRSVITLALTWWAIRRAGVSFLGNRRGLLFLRGLSGFAALTCFFYSVAHLPLAEATVIQFTHPIFTALLAGLFLKESVGLAVFGGTISGFFGMMLIAQPGVLFGNASPIELPVLLLALAGSLLTAVAYVLVRKLSTTEHPLVAIVYFPLVSVPAAAVTALTVWVWPTPAEWGLLLLAGVTTQLGQLFLTRGLYRERAGRATSIGYLQLVFAVIWGFLFFGDLPTAVSLSGMGLIVLGTLVIGSSARVRTARVI